MKLFARRSIIVFAIFLAHPQILFAQWTSYPTVTVNLLWNIAFADRNTVYAVGPGTLMKSYDAGRSWIDLMRNILPLNPDSNFFNLHFLNKDTGFVFTGGENRNVFKTLDGGFSWTDLSQPALGIGLLDMQFLSPAVGYATSGYKQDSTLSKTMDGGLTWQRLRTPSTCFAPMALYFFDELTGLVGESEIFKTLDGGLSWTETKASPGWAPGHRISNYFFANARSGFAITDQWNLYTTNDGGDSWSLASLPFKEDWGCRGLAFDQHGSGYIAGFTLGNLLVSADGGVSWKSDPGFPPSELPMCVAVSNEGNVIVGTREGDVVVKNKEPLAAVNLNASNGLRISPNPTNGLISFYSASAIQYLEIMDALGRSLGQVTPMKDGDLYKADLGNREPGLYFIRAVGEGWQASGKIILR